MVGVIEHGNTGANAAGMAFGAGLSGYSEGLMAGKAFKLEKQKAQAQVAYMTERMKGERQDRQLMKKSWDLQEQFREAALVADQAKLPPMVGPNGPVMQGPPEASGRGPNDVPGVQVQDTYWSEEKVWAYNNGDEETREALFSGWQDEKDIVRFEATIAHFDQRIADMEGAGPGYEGVDLAQNEELKLLVEQGKNAVEQFRRGAMTGQEVHQVLSGISGAMIDAGIGAQEKLYYSQAIGGAIAQTLGEMTAIGMGAGTEKLEYQQGIMEQWVNGDMPGYVAIGMLGMSPQQARGFVSWVRQATPQGQGPPTRESQGAMTFTGPGGQTRGGGQQMPSGPDAPAPESPEETQRGPRTGPGRDEYGFSAFDGLSNKKRNHLVGKAAEFVKKNDSNGLAKLLEHFDIAEDDASFVEALAKHLRKTREGFGSSTPLFGKSPGGRSLDEAFGDEGGWKDVFDDPNEAYQRKAKAKGERKEAE